MIKSKKCFKNTERESEQEVNTLYLSDRLYLKPICIDDVNEKYLKWMNDLEVNQYLESRFSKHSIATLTEYVKKINLNPDIYFFTICIQSNNEHIGNIKIGPVNKHHLRADIGIMIGEKKWWGKGFATEAISIVTRYAFEYLKLNRLNAGCYAANRGSARAFEKCGWTREGLLRGNALLSGQPHDCIILGITLQDYFKLCS